MNLLLPSRHLAKVGDYQPPTPLPNHEIWGGDIAYLDRDGVLNIGSENYINDVDELIVFPDAGDCIARLRAAGYRICIVTNQSPIGRNFWGHDTLAEINSALSTTLLSQNPEAHLDLILYSPYVPWSGAWARKGRPGMLQAGRQILNAAEVGKGVDAFDYGKDYTAVEEGNSFMVGDRRADMLAGLNFGIRTFHCDADIGLGDVIERVLDVSDEGDSLPN